MKTANKEKQFEDPIYKCFLAAFKEELKTRERKVISAESGVTIGYISDILSLKAKASYDKREAISVACGKSYLEFLAAGWTLASTDFVPDLKKNEQGFILLPESTPEAKIEVESDGDKEMEAVVKHLLSEHKKERAELNEKIQKLIAENATLKAQLEGIQGAMEHGQIQRPVNE